jgi:hypothetical protein
MRFAYVFCFSEQLRKNNPMACIERIQGKSVPFFYRPAPKIRKSKVQSDSADLRCVIDGAEATTECAITYEDDTNNGYKEGTFPK